MKQLDLNKTVYELTKENPDLVNILRDLGFDEITKKGMLSTVGRIMTIPKGAKTKRIDLDFIIETLKDNGYQVKGTPAVEEETVIVEPEIKNDVKELKDYLKRLNNGESLESVRADFVENFNDVEASEIMKAEQEMIEEGTPLEEVQQLCDLHSALFHGTTREERIANAEVAVAESLKREETNKSDKNEEKLQELIATPGHPLQTFSEENEVLEDLLSDINMRLDKDEDVRDELKKIREIAIHYAKKGDLLYPTLKVKYDISGPSNVMWTVDDEIRSSLAKLVNEENRDTKWLDTLNDTLKRIEEMIYKESNILFPILAENFTEDDWIGVYRDSKDYPVVFDIESEEWSEAEEELAEESSEDVVESGKVESETGEIKFDEIIPVLNTIPLELTFIDDKDMNKFFNEGPKAFKRPLSALQRDVFSCHPPKIEKAVRRILDDFKNNKRDSVQIWMEKEGVPYLVEYIAVRDKDGTYKGTLEAVHDMKQAKEHFTKEN